MRSYAILAIAVTASLGIGGAVMGFVHRGGAELAKRAGIVVGSEEDRANPVEKVVKTPAEWKKILTPDQFAVTREHGTERPFGEGSCHARFEPGEYRCVCCDTPLFNAQRKFNSGTGWPSFTEPVSRTAIATRIDTSHGMVRVEVLCRTCDAHLGHVFDDGPDGAMRYCINSVAMKHVQQPAAPATQPAR